MARSRPEASWTWYRAAVALPGGCALQAFSLYFSFRAASGVQADVPLAAPPFVINLQGLGIAQPFTQLWCSTPVLERERRDAFLRATYPTLTKEVRLSP